jgi:RNA polymerase sigma-70 factor (ECF subfamily)
MPGPNGPTSGPDLDAIAAHRPYHHLIRRLLQRSGVRPTEIEDAHQDVLTALVVSLPSHWPVKSLEAFIATITLRRAADCHRRRARSERLSTDGDAADSAVAPDSQQGIPPPDRASLLKERVRTLDVLLGRMDPELREVFILIEIEEMGVEAVAAALEMLESTVRSRRDRARKQFEELIRRHQAEKKRRG